MPRPLAPTFRVLALAVLVALPFAFLGACTTETGVTPDCVSDVNVNGVTPVDKGCSGFAICTDSAGKPANPTTCCMKDAEGKPYVGSALAFCLLSYGVGEPTSSASSSSSSSSTGTGG